jgi:PPP family 3-phenylpropionic acid transporter
MSLPTISIRNIPARARAGAFYLAFMAAGGAVYPFLYLLYRRHGLTAPQIGVAIAVAHVMNFLVSPALGAASDLLQRRGGPSLLALACLGAGPAILLVQAARGLAQTLGAVVVWSFFSGGILSLADASTLRMLGQDRHVYGRVRVWGAVGSVAASWAAGQLGDRLSLEWVFPINTALLLICAAVAATLPKVRYATTSPYKGEALRLLRHPRVALFLASVVLIGVGYMGWRGTFSLYLDDLGGKAGLIGTFYALSSLVEIPVIASSRRWLGRLGARRSLLVAFSVYLALWLAASGIVRPQAALALALLHGLSFATYQVAGVVYMGEVTPPAYAGLAQGLYGSFSRGLGSILGSLIGGALFARIGGPWLYRLSMGMGALALGCLLVIQSVQGQDEP